MDYREACSFLDNLQMHKIKLGLEAMRTFLQKVGEPEKNLKFVHVAGTNGKGSVSVSLLTVLSRAGYKVGLYTSPHLSSVRERFRINDRYITEVEFAAMADRVVTALAGDTITYFECTTAMAMLWFAESDVDLVILETGLGGRLDATNVVTPLVSVITSISMDHEAYLGNTIGEVAAEKAGIIKPSVPVVANGSGEIVRQVIEERTVEMSSPLYLLDRDFRYYGESNDDWSWQGEGPISGQIGGLKCAMRGAYQRENASLVIAALKLLGSCGYRVDDSVLCRGLAEVHWPGRLEYLVLDKINRQRLDSDNEQGRIRYLLDGAHNPEGVKNMADTLAHEYSFDRLIFVWGAMNDKDISGGLAAVLPLADTLILTRPDGERSAEPEELAAHLPKRGNLQTILARDVGDALHHAEKLAGTDDIVVVAGSLYLVGAVRSMLVGELVDG